jgi:membrane protease YdiL (CAAX protease family)
MDEPHFLSATGPFWLMSAGSLAWGVSRLRSGRPLLKYEPRRPVPWNGTLLLIAVLIFLFLPTAIHGIARARFAARLASSEQVAFAALAENAKPGYPGYALTMMQAECAGKLSAAAIVVVMLAAFAGADGRDLGLSFHLFGRRLRVGLIAFFMITPPVLLLQAMIIEFGGIKYTHPLVEGLRDRSNRDILYWSLITALAVAPLVEELFFRGLLQGWLERTVQKLQAAINARQLLAQRAAWGKTRSRSGQPDGTVLLTDTPGAEAFDQPIMMPSASHAPNILTSILFGLMHWGHGPAPFVLIFFSLGLGYLYRQTHSLWPSIIVHFLLNGFSMALLLSGIARP